MSSAGTVPLPPVRSKILPGLLHDVLQGDAKAFAAGLNLSRVGAVRLVLVDHLHWPHAHLRQACTAFVIEMAAEHAAIGQSRPVTDTARGRAVQVAVMAMQHDLARNCHITGNETAGRRRGDRRTAAAVNHVHQRLSASEQPAATGQRIAFARDRLAIEDQRRVPGDDLERAPMLRTRRLVTHAGHGLAFDIRIRRSGQHPPATRGGVAAHDPQPCPLPSARAFDGFR
ncbi:hypothetical protein G6F31_017330 [Rhizopus arrhizus]|nr:hypothetical protein G6F31_017330 [Rhizopus arrhizus]